MAKEIEDFKAWHPPKDAKETGDQPLSEYYYEDGWFKPNSVKRCKLTPTGWLWLTLPWLFLIKKRLSFTLLEFSVFIRAWGSDSGMLARLNAPPVATGVLLYTAFHLHILLFAEALYCFRI